MTPDTATRSRHHRNARLTALTSQDRRPHWAPSVFSLFENWLTPVNNGLCKACLANKRLAHRPPQTSVAKSFVSTDHTDPYPRRGDHRAIGEESTELTPLNRGIRGM